MIEEEKNEQKIVAPGEVLEKGMDWVAGQNTFRKKEKVISKRLGLLSVKGRIIKVLPIKGGYEPNYDDDVVGRIIEAVGTGWQVDIGCAYTAYLPISEYSTQFIDTKRIDTADLLKEGDLIFCRVIKFTKSKNLLVSTKGPKYKKLSDGIIHELSPQKIPRLIGKKGSMITMIKDETNTYFSVGPNGWVFYKNENPETEILIREILELVEEQGHKKGLTEKVEKMLKVKK